MKNSPLPSRKASDMSDRNLNPHAEARAAMAIWSHEYAYEQKGGSMDFWDSRTPGQKATCVKFVDDIRGLPRANGAHPEQKTFAAENIPSDIDQIATEIVRADYTAGDEEPDWLMYLAIAKAILAERDRHTPAPQHISVGGKFELGDRVRKTKGSSWHGLIVGFYSTELTPIGYAVESEREPGSVQIYPESALAKLEDQR